MFGPVAQLVESGVCEGEGAGLTPVGDNSTFFSLFFSCCLFGLGL
jgi:hypothetical protein